MMNRTMSMGFASWHHNWAEWMLTQNALFRGLSRLTDFQRSRGFNSWTAMVGERRRLSRCVVFMRNREVSKGMVTWRSVWTELTLRNNTLRRGLSRLLSRDLARGWSAWVEMSDEKKELMRLLQKGVGVMANRQLATGFVFWRERCSAVAHVAQHAPWLSMVHKVHKLLDLVENRPIGAQELMMQVALDGMASRATRLGVERVLTRAYKLWASRAVSIARRQSGMRRALGFWRNGELYRGWLEWEQRTAERMTMREAANLLLQRRVALAFAFWRLEQWHQMLATTVSKISTPHMAPRKPTGAPLMPWEERPDDPESWHGGRCQSDKEPRRPPPQPRRSKRGSSSYRHEVYRRELTQPVRLQASYGLPKQQWSDKW